MTTRKRKTVSKRKSTPKRAPVKRRKPAPSPAAPIGRPSGYKPEFCAQAKKLAELGARDVDLADFFDVAINTIHNWKTSHPEFLHSLKVGKDQVDDRVERSLLQRALGYTFDSVKVFFDKENLATVTVPIREHVPPDTTACIFWLKNRRKADWRDRQELEHTGKDGGPIETKETGTLSELELARRIAFALEQAAQRSAS